MTFITPERKLKATDARRTFPCLQSFLRLQKKQIVGKEKFLNRNLLDHFSSLFGALAEGGKYFRTDEYLHILEPRLMQKCVKYYFCCFWRNECCQRVPFRLRCPWTFGSALNCYFARSRVIYFRTQISQLICRRVCSLCIGRFRLRRTAKIWDFSWDYKGVSSANLP